MFRPETSERRLQKQRLQEARNVVREKFSDLAAKRKEALRKYRWV
jgi:hypothetical protein